MLHTIRNESNAVGPSVLISEVSLFQGCPLRGFHWIYLTVFFFAFFFFFTGLGQTSQAGQLGGGLSLGGGGLGMGGLGTGLTGGGLGGLGLGQNKFGGGGGTGLLSTGGTLGTGPTQLGTGR